MQSEIPIIGQKRDPFCGVCGKPRHPFNTKCNYADLVERVKKLLEANSTIPAILNANTEATQLANMFKVNFERSAQALVLFEKVVMEYPEGTQICKQFHEGLEALWPVKTSSQDTGEAPATSSPESTTPSASEGNPSTEATVHGVPTALASLRQTLDATPAESPPPSSTT